MRHQQVELVEWAPRPCASLELMLDRLERKLGHQLHLLALDNLDRLQEA
jgi:hypothetical protein